MHVDAIRIRFDLEDRSDGVQKREVVDGVARVQQGAVDVEDADVGLLDEFLSASELVDRGHLASATIISSCVFYSSATYLDVLDGPLFGKSCTKWSTITRSIS